MSLAKRFAGFLFLQVTLATVTTGQSNNNVPTCQQLSAKLRQLDSKFESKFRQLDNKLAVEQYKNSQLEQKVSALKASLDSAITRRNNNRLASSFLAVRTRNQIIPGRAIVKFDLVRHNVAPPHFGYDQNTGYYRCPYDGTYIFHVNMVGGHTRGEGGAYYRFQLKKGSMSLAVAGTEISNEVNDDQALSASVVTPCRKGEIVYVQNRDAASRNVWIGSEGFAHFTGAKIG